MKKITLLFVAILAFNFAKGQDLPLLDFGLKAGVNLASLGDLPDGFENDGSKIGIVGGVFARFNIPGVGLFAQPELVFAQSGGKTKSALGTGEINLNNIDFTVLLGKRFGLNSLGLRIGVGPNFTSVLSAKDADDDDINLDNEFLVGLQAGAGLDVSKFSIDLRYQTTFTKLFDNNGLSGVKPAAIQLTVGYKLF